MKIIPIILSGGSGTRLWPLSRRQHPKQYLSLFGHRTMLQETIVRLGGISNIEDPVIVCNVDHRFLVAEQCREINCKNPTILLEPISRNTSAAITSSILLLSEKQNLNEKDVFIVLSADHLIEDLENFYSAIDTAVKYSHSDLVVFGVKPTSSNVGYGYIKYLNQTHKSIYQVEGFVEKPSKDTAQKYLDSGDYLWNSGMFVFQLGVFTSEALSCMPDTVEIAQRVAHNFTFDLGFIWLDKDLFSLFSCISIDYALMEKSNRILVVPLETDWYDIGSWNALYDLSDKDKYNNAIFGDVFANETTNTYVNSTPGHSVVTLGIDNMVVIHTPDATLVAKRDEMDRLSNIVQTLSSNKKFKSDNSKKVYRPWGWYDSLDIDSNFHVKRIHVNPGGKLSLQSHENRAEHWVVIQGKALVYIDGETSSIEKNQSIYVPIRAKHSLENADSSECLELIEVQSGTYFGEDDIIRYDDIYGRSDNK